ncbi:MAG: tetratricopeptide repeat protein [Deltaproteobacteria bacterium]|nr:tetratricopeptide repeat protein [Deltaproteobacteria bacterium]
MSYGELFSTRLLAEERYEEAIDQASQEITNDAEEPEAWFNRGLALANLGRLDGALTDYEAALGLDASASNLDPAVLDDELFEVVRRLAVGSKADPGKAKGFLSRYTQLLPAGRHIGDIPKWVAHIDGVETVWVRES